MWTRTPLSLSLIDVYAHIQEYYVETGIWWALNRLESETMDHTFLCEGGDPLLSFHTASLFPQPFEESAVSTEGS